MRGPYRAQVSSVVEALSIDVPDGFSWFGVPYRHAAVGPQSSLGYEQRLQLLSLVLKDHLYRYFYCTGTPVPHGPDLTPSSGGTDVGAFAVVLSKANSGAGTWEAGWRVDELTSTAATVTKGMLTVVASIRDCRAQPGCRLREGEYVSLRHPRESFHRSPGFYLARGNAPLTENEPLVRVYWNTTAAGAGVLVRQVTERLNSCGIPFHLKVLDDPRSYARCDSAVLYLATRDYARVRADHAGRLLDALAVHLIDAVPALTKRVAAGVGVAEEVAEHSFGAHRCGVLARAVIEGSRLDCPSTEHVALVEEHFGRAGIDPERPYLRAGSRDNYATFRSEDTCAPRGTTSDTLSEPAPGRDELLNAACRIGRLLVGTARWHADQCNWIGALGPAPQQRQASRFGAMGPDLYDGTSGIALFLGELSRITGDHEVRRTALGAIAHALEHAAPTTEQAGFYLGPWGIAAVTARLGHLLDRDDLTMRARGLAAACPVTGTEFDLMAGAAGRIIALLILHRLLGDDHLVAAACTTGHVLVDRAEDSTHGVSWSSGGIPGQRNLTGLSHGTAGAATALLELFSVSGVDDFRHAAESAMEYERAWFDDRERNWPDFRQVMAEGDLASVRLPYATTWCHGAPGIALSRIRAAELLPARIYEDEATAALTTTRDHVRSRLRSGHVNYSLCHGVAGNAEILFTGSRSSAALEPDVGATVRDTARRAVATCSERGEWPCGVGGGGPNPSLMLGWAGVGNFFLRLAREDTPSVLAPLAGPSWGVASSGRASG